MWYMYLSIYEASDTVAIQEYGTTVLVVIPAPTVPLAT